MDLRKSPRNPAHSSKLIKKKVVSKSKKLTIDIPDSEVPTNEIFNKNSPQHKYHPEAHKSLVSVPSNKQKKSPKRKSSVIANPKAFVFPPAPKAQKKISNLGITQNKRKLSPKPKTPMQKKKVHKLIKRPKTTISSEKFKRKSDSPGLKAYITQADVNIKQTHEEIYNEHLFQTFQGLKIVKSLPPVDLEQLKEKRISVPRRPGYEGKKTVIFDLDETLVHCCENIEEANPDITVSVVFPNGEIITAGINIRPYAIECLKEANKDFEVFVFTASHQCYANVVLDQLDPTGELIHQRFFRENCINMNGVYIKDLRIFGDRKLSQTVIVDNASYSYAYQIDNGIPIISWHDDREDKELLNLSDYLQSLVGVDDIRETNFETFHLRTFYDDYMCEYLLQQQQV